ncbi:hypothetical protein BaRGS_00032453 [Batillaria attramentaria]|uniref:Uncharacterized protein n=1 Tax=Batillaria attramentaria TaxID=370345 RepID=A0ABD0JNR8_9CAEN
MSLINSLTTLISLVQSLINAHRFKKVTRTVTLKRYQSHTRQLPKSLWRVAQATLKTYQCYSGGLPQALTTVDRAPQESYQSHAEESLQSNELDYREVCGSRLVTA